MARVKHRELVKYHNDLNLIAFKSFTKIENDIFFALVYKLKNENNREINLDFSELRSLIGLSNYKNNEIVAFVRGMAKKFIGSSIEKETDNTIQFFSIFEILEVPKEIEESNQIYIRAQVNKHFLYLLNELEKGGFTMFELIEFTNLSSKYSQTLYRLLKQFKVTGVVNIFKNDWNKFAEIMDFPKTYNTRMCDIDKRILKPAVKELSEKNLFNNENVIFKNLKYEKLRGASRGRKVYGITFTFDKQSNREIEEKIIKKMKEEKEEYINETMDLVLDGIKKIKQNKKNNDDEREEKRLIEYENKQYSVMNNQTKEEFTYITKQVILKKDNSVILYEFEKDKPWYEYSRIFENTYELKKYFNLL